MSETSTFTCLQGQYPGLAVPRACFWRSARSLLQATQPSSRDAAETILHEYDFRTGFCMSSLGTSTSLPVLIRGKPSCCYRLLPWLHVTHRGPGLCLWHQDCFTKEVRASRCFLCKRGGNGAKAAVLTSELESFPPLL